MEKISTKKILWILTFAIVLFVGMQHLNVVGQIFQGLLGLLAPFLIGIGIAFVLNVPMRFLENKLFGRATGLLKKWKRAICIVLTLVLLFLVIWMAVQFVVPQIARSFATLKESIPQGIEKIQIWSAPYAEQAPQLVEWIQGIDVDWTSLFEQIKTFLEQGVLNLANGIVNVVVSAISSTITFFIGFVFALYSLAKKEVLKRQAKMLLFANLSEKHAERAVEIGRLTERTFSGFLSGQCLEAMILGAMFVVVLWVFGFPYALLIGVLVAFTALIPVFGAFVGCIFGAFFILMVNPIQAFWFIVIFLALQQLEENLIYPRVVGRSVNLPSLWVLVAVTLGGSAFGILGMLVFIPLFSVFYALLGQDTKRKLEEKNVPKEKLS